MNPSSPFDKPSSGNEPGPNLSESQLGAIRAEADRYRSAQRQLLEALGVLWNAKLDISIAAGRVNDINDTLMRPVQFYDNCNCGGGGGMGPLGPACW